MLVQKIAEFMSHWQSVLMFLADTVNSLEIWIIGTISFVSLALVEYAIAMIAYNRPRAHALKRYRKMNNKRGLKSSEGKHK